MTSVLVNSSYLWFHGAACLVLITNGMLFSCVMNLMLLASKHLASHFHKAERGQVCATLVRYETHLCVDGIVLF